MATPISPAEPSITPLELVAVRHGLSLADLAVREALAAGHADTGLTHRDADVPLANQGWIQAESLGRRLAALSTWRRPDVVHCSPYLRARQTLEVIQARLADDDPGPRPAVRLDERLRGRDAGVLELLTPAAVARDHPTEAARAARLGPLAHRPPGGENGYDVQLRVRSFLRDLEGRGDRRVLLVTHAEVILMLRATLEDLTEEQVSDLMDADPVREAALTSWSRRGGVWELQAYNDTDHLDGEPDTGSGEATEQVG